MKWYLCSLVALTLAIGSVAQVADVKTEGEKAAAAFETLRNDPAAKPDRARFDAVAKAGIAFLAQYPTHAKADSVVNNLGTFATTLKGKENLSQRLAWGGFITFALVEASQKEGLSDDAKAAFQAVSAVVAATQLRDDPNRDALVAAREKVDALAASPGGERFVPRAERAFGDALKAINPNLFERHLQRLAQHTNKSVVSYAQAELTLIEARRVPLEYTFTSMDGKAVDLAKLRGKFVAILFFPPKAEKLKDWTLALSDLKGTYGGRNVEVILVACAKEEAKPEVEALLKKNRPPGPVLFDPKGFGGDLAKSFVVTWGPQGVVLDREGKLIGPATWAGAFDAMVKKAIK